MYMYWKASTCDRIACVHLRCACSIEEALLSKPTTGGTLVSPFFGSTTMNRNTHV
jgi:hypothetical protein